MSTINKFEMDEATGNFSVLYTDGTLGSGALGDMPVVVKNEDGEVTGLQTLSGDEIELGAPADQTYLRYVATSSAVFNGITVGQTQCMSRSLHIACEDLKSIALQYANMYVAGGQTTANNGQELTSGTSMTITASIEYPVGTFTRVLFSGATSQVIATNQKVQSDFVEVNIPKGEEFWVRTFQVNSGGIIFCNGAPAQTGEGFVVSGSTDLTMGGSVTQATAAICKPLAILGMTSNEAACLFGDSIVQGSADQVDNYKVCGIFSRALRDKLIGFTNLGVRGDRADWYLASNSIRSTMTQYATRVYCNYGINDLLNGRSYDQITTDITSFWASITNTDFKYHCHLAPPSTASTTYYATTAGQTPTGNNVTRGAINQFLDLGRVPEVRSISVKATETAENSGVWLVEDTGRTITDAAITSGSNVLTSASAVFTLKDDFTAVRIVGAGTASGNLTGVLRFVNATTANITTNGTTALNASTTVSGGTAYIAAAKFTVDGLHYNARGKRELLRSGFMEFTLP